MVKPPPQQFLIALGSNLGDRLAVLRLAVAKIKSLVGCVDAVSSLYETAPIGAADQRFYNAALVCTSTLDPEALLAALLQIEQQLGRLRLERWGNRLIDLDLLLWRTERGSDTWHSPTLTLPHPEMLSRNFVLYPASEIAPTWVHPTSGEPLKALAARLKEPLTGFMQTWWIP